MAMEKLEFLAVLIGILAIMVIALIIYALVAGPGMLQSLELKING